jgi:hypothetical protein
MVWVLHPLEAHSYWRANRFVKKRSLKNMTDEEVDGVVPKGDVAPLIPKDARSQRRERLALVCGPGVTGVPRS